MLFVQNRDGLKALMQFVFILHKKAWEEKFQEKKINSIFEHHEDKL